MRAENKKDAMEEANKRVESGLSGYKDKEPKYVCMLNRSTWRVEKLD